MLDPHENAVNMMARLNMHSVVKKLVLVYLCKTEALRMRYLGRGFCLEENTRFWEVVQYDAH